MILQNKKYGILDMFLLSFKVSPYYTALLAVKRTIDALIPTLTIFITANFINTSIAVLNKKTEMNSIHIPIILLSAVMVYNAIIGMLMKFVNCRADIYYRQRLLPEALEKRARLEYKHIENQKTADLINRVCPKLDYNVRQMYFRVLDVAENILFVAGIIITLFTKVWWVALFILLTGIPIMIIATRAGKESYNADKEVSKVDRRVNYLSNVLKSREAVEERSVYGYSDQLNRQYEERYEYARKFRLKVSLRNFIKQKMGGIFTSFLSVFAMFALLQPVMRGDLDLGMFIGLMGAVFGLSGRLSWGVNWLVMDISTRREYLRDLTEFMALSEHTDANALPAGNMSFNRLEFREVSFKYPGTDTLILDKISFVIENGKHYSFVGVNGAGKTTIIKLLTGLYMNYEGEILVDGKSFRDLSQSEVKGLSSVVYQDFARYFITLFDNIAIADPNKKDNRENVLKAAELLGLSDAISKLPDGIDTFLGKIQEKGVDLSGGEWQRVAMARGVLSPAPLRILDEPTASLDPVSESMIYKNFENISQGRTTIFISHRLGSTKLADIIYVLSGGKIIESGTHSELMSQTGIYSEMFKAQAEWYTDSDQESTDELGAAANE